MFIVITTDTDEEYIYGDKVIKKIRVAHSSGQYDDFIPERFFEILREWHAKSGEP